MNVTENYAKEIEWNLVWLTTQSNGLKTSEKKGQTLWVAINS